MKEIDKGILLRKINFSETSLIVTIYTFSDGIQTYIFQGGKKKSSALFPMSRVEIEFYKRPDSELGKLTNVQSAHGSSEIPFHPIRSTIAFFMADVLFNCLKTDQSDAYLFEFLELQIEELERSTDLSMLPLHFLIRLSRSLGIEPIIQPDNPRYFVPIDGEFRSSHDFGSQAESGSHVDLLLQLYAEKIPLDIKRENRTHALSLMLKYFEIHIPSFNVNRSLEVLKEVLE